MFGNLFSRPHEELLDHQSWVNRNKRSRDELDAVDSDGEEGADFGGQRKAGRLDERLGDDRHDDESDEGMGSMEQDGAQQGEGSHMVDVSWEEEEGRQMMLMLTARQDVGEEAAAAGVDEEDQEAAGPTKEEMEAMLRDAVQVVRQAREQRGRAAGGGVSPSLDEQSEASQDLLACAPGPFKSSLDPVALMERLLWGFKPLLQAGTRPMAQLQDLLHSLAVTPPDKARDSMEQVASELCNLQEELRVRLPYRKGALARAADKSLASLKVRAAAAAAGAGLAGVVPAEGARKPDEAFEQQMEACNEVVDQLRTLDEAEERLEEYRRHYIERGQALVADKDAWIKTWQAKLLDHTTDAERAKKSLLELDERFDQLVCASPSSSSSSSLSSLGLVSRLLDLTRSEKGRELVAQRQAAAEALEQREKKRTRAATNLRLVEGFIALLRVLCDGGKARLAQLYAALVEEVAGIRARLQAELQGQVAGAAQTLQALLEFHEARKTRASKSAQLREHELRQHTSLFGQDTPTETQRLESCVKELRRVVSHSQTAIEKAMHSQHAFWARVEEQLPSPIALELVAAYRKQMANPPAIGGSFTPGAMATTGADEGAAGAGTGMMMGGGYSPAAAAAHRRSEGPLAEAVAQGAAVATQEQQRVAASEETWASKHSPAKRDNDACAVM